MNFFTRYGINRSNKKSYLLAPYRQADPAIQRKIIMRLNLIAFFLLLSIMHVCAKVHAQDITLSETNASLKTVLLEIKKQSGLQLWFNNKHLKQAKPVTIHLKSASLKEALDACFRDQPLSYDLLDNTIVIKTKPVSFKERVTNFLKAIKISGNVSDEKGNPLSGVTVKIKDSETVTTTGEDGKYSIEVPNAEAVLQFSYVGFQTLERATGQDLIINVTLKEKVASLEEFGVVSTGYQSMSKERVNGSFVRIDSALLNRAISTDILSRLKGNVSGLASFQPSDQIVNTSPSARNTGIIIRGISSISNQVNRSPLIVLDNFPYEGDLQNINPNDIESITVLKDAAAASIWGARSGNGVVVITTKKGAKNQSQKIDVNLNATLKNKPDLKYDRNFIDASSYVDIETYLFNQGYFNSSLTDNLSHPPITPVVEILRRLRGQSITSQEAQNALNVLRSSDVRNDYDKYIYQDALNQQYHIGTSSSTKFSTHAFSVGYDQNSQNLKRNGYDRLTLNTLNTYTPISNLELSFGLNFSQSKTSLNNQLYYGTGIAVGGFEYAGIYPYARFADENGNPLSVVKDYSTQYVQNAPSVGLKNWEYKPLDQLANADNSTRIRNIILRGGLKYKVFSFLNLDVLYQNERQKISSKQFQNGDAYATRNLVNRFSVLNGNGSITYQFPKDGGTLNLGEYDWNSNNLRAQLSLDRTFGEHVINAIAGAELRELRTSGFNRVSYGYDEQFGTSQMNLNYSAFLPVNPVGTALIPFPDGTLTGELNRFISFYGNVGYEYDKRYSLTLSGRNDGANLFGININQKITPLWSAGLGWIVSNESFYKSSLLPYLKLRLTYGINGNIYYGSAYTTGFYRTSAMTGLPAISNLTAPNLDLKWERVKNLNLGVDFQLVKNRASGTFEYFKKEGTDLVQPVQLPHYTGFMTAVANSASTRTTGIDLTLNSRNIIGNFNWNSTLLLSTVRDKVTKYDVPQDPSSIQGNYLTVGKPLYGLYGYQWEGLDPVNGDPQGYLNGKVSKDYAAIINNFNPDSLFFLGRTLPGIFGSLRNDFSYKGISVSVNIIFKADYVFRRSSIDLNYENLIRYPNADYSLRWQQTGDEKRTNIPSVVYPANSARSNFYKYSEILVEDADHIRLQDIRIGYNLTPVFNKRTSIKSLQVFSYLNNIGIISRKNNYGIDPDLSTDLFSHVAPVPFSVSFGINASF